MPKKSFRFELYSVHGHLESGTPDYVKLFGAMTNLKGYHTQEGKRHIAIGTASFVNEQFFLTAYTGPSEKSLLFFDVAQKTELTESMLPGRFPARKTYAMIDARKRFLLIDSRRGSLHALDLAALFEEHAHEVLPDYKTLELVFNPVADVEFIKRLDALERIQAATITVARPNVDWTDRHNELTHVADESNAKALDVTARARRGQSLSRDAGLVQFIKQFAASARSMFEKIKVVGATSEDSGLITLNLSKYVEHVNVLMNTDPITNLPNDNDVRGILAGYLDAKPAEPEEK